MWGEGQCLLHLPAVVHLLQPGAYLENPQPHWLFGIGFDIEGSTNPRPPPGIFGKIKNVCKKKHGTKEMVIQKLVHTFRLISVILFV